MGLFDKFKLSLAKTRAAIVSKFVSPLWSAEDMERALLGADFGPRLTAKIISGVKKRLELNPRSTREEAFEAASLELESILDAPPLSKITARPHVTLFVGVNGAGKTTSVAKYAKRLKQSGAKVLLAAADTFRAAAIEQLKTWGQRLDIEVVSSQYGGDPGAITHDAVQRARSGEFTHLLIDTAGRQHNRSNLMQELQKVKRVAAKALPGAPHECWIVVDAPTGGNALVQAREFHAAMDLTGVIITKLDGSARGGMVAAIRKETGLPIRFVGLGEGEDDLEPFDAASFSKALWNESSLQQP